MIKEPLFTNCLGCFGLRTGALLLNLLQIVISTITLSLSTTYMEHHETKQHLQFLKLYVMWVSMDRVLVIFTSIIMILALLRFYAKFLYPYIVWTIIQAPTNIACCIMLAGIIEMWVILQWILVLMEMYGGLLAISINILWKMEDPIKKKYYASKKTASSPILEE